MLLKDITLQFWLLSNNKSEELDEKKLCPCQFVYKAPFLNAVMDYESSGMLFMFSAYNRDFNKVKTSKVNLESICYL